MYTIVVIDNAYEPHKRKMTSKLILLLMALWPRVEVVETLDDYYALDQARVGGYVLTGSHHRLSIKGTTTLPTLFLNLAALASGKPVLGICFGFQFMTWVEGAAVVKRPYPLRGSYPTVFTFCQTIKYLHYHCFDRPACIPPSFVVHGIHGCTKEGVMVCHKTKPWIGVLFHPEVSGSFGIKLLKDFISKLQNYG